MRATYPRTSVRFSTGSDISPHQKSSQRAGTSARSPQPTEACGIDRYVFWLPNLPSSALDILLAPAETPVYRLPVEHLSPSSIDTYLKCPESFRREKVEGQVRPSTAETIFGSAFHKAAERNFLQKIDSHQDIAVPEMRDLTGDSFNLVLEEEKGSREINWHDQKPHLVQAEVITAMVGEPDGLPGYHQVLAPTVQPVAVERWVNVMLPIGVPLKGRLDVETVDGQVWDLKTSKRAKTQDDIDKATAPSSYLWSRRAEGNPAAGFGYQVVIRTKKPQTQELVTSRSEFQLRQFEALVRMVAGEITHLMDTYGPEGPWPGASPLAWWCSPGQCSFYSSCPWRRT